MSQSTNSYLQPHGEKAEHPRTQLKFRLDGLQLLSLFPKRQESIRKIIGLGVGKPPCTLNCNELHGGSCVAGTILRSWYCLSYSNRTTRAAVVGTSYIFKKKKKTIHGISIDPRYYRMHEVNAFFHRSITCLDLVQSISQDCLTLIILVERLREASAKLENENRLHKP